MFSTFNCIFNVHKKELSRIYNAHSEYLQVHFMYIKVDSPAEVVEEARICALPLMYYNLSG